MMAVLMDPTFEYHLAVTRVWAELARSLADSLILPFDCRDYTESLTKSVAKLKTDYKDKMMGRGITFGEDLMDEINVYCLQLQHIACIHTFRMIVKLVQINSS